jgi:hypothetical protein
MGSVLDSVGSVLRKTSQKNAEDGVGFKRVVMPGDWIAFRQHLEGVALAWLCNDKSWVRSELVRLLKQIGAKVGGGGG